MRNEINVSGFTINKTEKCKNYIFEILKNS